MSRGFGPGDILRDAEGRQGMDIITSEQFHDADGVEDWRVLGDGVCTYFRTGSFATAARLLQAISELAGLGDHHPDVDLRYEGVTVRLITATPDCYGLSEGDVELARQVSAAARELGIPADPSAGQTVQLTIDALAGPAVMPFWRAVLGYRDAESRLSAAAGERRFRTARLVQVAGAVPHDVTRIDSTRRPRRRHSGATVSTLEPSGSARPGDGLRIGDAEREEVVTRLQSAFAEGRLDLAEFDERLGQVYTARTTGDLVPLTADLPVPAATRKPAERVDRPVQRSGDKSLRLLWQIWATVVAINVVVWVLVSLSSGGFSYPWPIWVAGPWGAVLLVSTVFYRRG